MELTWLEISKTALCHNLNVFRKQIDKNILAPVVKGNAYGHGLVECAGVFEESGADFLCVNAFYEALRLRQAGIRCPLLIIGYIPLSDLKKALDLDCDLVIYNPETIKKLTELKKTAKIHLKIETGTHRQGITLRDLEENLKLIQSSPNLNCIGLSTHFANVEDRIDNEYALYQLNEFQKAIHLTEDAGFSIKYLHCANSAASLILPESHFNFVRPGIGMYGLWPSEKTKKAAEKMKLNIVLKPVLTWKTRIAQIKEVGKDALIGYGCTYKMPKKGRIAVLPIGYYEGFSRSMGNKAHVLIQGKRAPVIGRVCMNMIMVNVSRIPDIKLEEEVVLIGKQGQEEITAEEMAEWSETINYEVTTKINEGVPRVLVD